MFPCNVKAVDKIRNDYLQTKKPYGLVDRFYWKLNMVNIFIMVHNIYYGKHSTVRPLKYQECEEGKCLTLIEIILFLIVVIDIPE